jgi:hypothetical protein
VNVSPHEGAALRVLSPNAVCYRDQTGSGAETAAQLRADGRITLTLCAFEGPPMILRLHGRGAVVPRGTPDDAAMRAAHDGAQEPPGARQIVRIGVDLVQTSCGHGVPLCEGASPGDRRRAPARPAGSARRARPASARTEATWPGACGSAGRSCAGAS